MQYAGIIDLGLYLAPYTINEHLQNNGEYVLDPGSVEPFLNASTGGNFYGFAPGPFDFGYYTGSNIGGDLVHRDLEGMFYMTTSGGGYNDPPYINWFSGVLQPFGGQAGTNYDGAFTVNSQQIPTTNPTVTAIDLINTPGPLPLTANEQPIERAGIFAIDHLGGYAPFIASPQAVEYGALFDYLGILPPGQDEPLFPPFTALYTFGIEATTYAFFNGGLTNTNGLLANPSDGYNYPKFIPAGVLSPVNDYTPLSGQTYAIPDTGDELFEAALNDQLWYNSHDFFIMVASGTFEGQGQTPIVADFKNNRYYYLRFHPASVEATDVIANTEGMQISYSRLGYFILINNAAPNFGQVFHTVDLRLTFTPPVISPGPVLKLPCYNPCVPMING